MKIRHLLSGAPLAALADLPLLFLRLALAYGFLEPATQKWQNISGIAAWFQELGLPLPTLQAYMAASTEAAGVVLLTLGLGTRLISPLLVVVMLVAIKTVHWANGFAAGSNGYEIPLYYLLMLLTVFACGPGRLSLDHVLFGRRPRMVHAASAAPVLA